MSRPTALIVCHSDRRGAPPRGRERERLTRTHTHTHTHAPRESAMALKRKRSRAQKTTALLKQSTATAATATSADPRCPSAVRAAQLAHDTDPSIVDILPVSDVIYRYAKAGLQFRHSVQLQRSSISSSSSSCTSESVHDEETQLCIRQTVSTGDLVVVSDDEHADITKHFKIAPWKQKDRPWRVGQVLAIVSCLAPPTTTLNTDSDKHEPPTLVNHNHCAIVQWLLPFQYIQKHDKDHDNADGRWVDPQQLKEIAGLVRRDFMLFQPPAFSAEPQPKQQQHSNDASVPFVQKNVWQSLVDLHRIRPAAATLLEWTDFRDKQEPHQLAHGCWEFFFHCHYRLPSAKSGIPTRRDRNDFASSDIAATATATAATAAAAAPSSSMTRRSAPPVTVVNGWHDMHVYNLLDGRLPMAHYAKLVQALTASYQAHVYEKPAQERFVITSAPNPKHAPETTFSGDDQRTHKRQKSANVNKENHQANATTSKKRKAVDMGNRRVEPAFNHVARSNEKSAKTKPHPQAHDELIPSNPLCVAVVERGPPCLVHKIKKAKTSCARLLYFCTHVTLTHKQHAPRRNWTIQVGDLVAVALGDARSAQPIYSVLGKKKQSLCQQSAWYPFAEPWCPAQVLALYHVETEPPSANDEPNSETLMQIRWFYRPNDLPQEVVDALSDSVRNDLFHHARGTSSLLESSRKLVEVDEHVVEVPVSTALGRVVTTSQVHPPTNWLNSFVGTDRIPQLPVLCRHIFRMAEFSGAEGLSLLREEEDWTEYAASPTAPAWSPFHRGLACPKSWPGKLKQLFLAYGGVREPTPTATKANKSTAVSRNRSPSNRSLRSQTSADTEESLVNAKVSSPPFYTDYSQGIEYFSELEINPPYQSYSVELSEGLDTSGRTWTIRLGDPIVLHSSVCSGRATYLQPMRPSTSKTNRAKHSSSFPFSTPWAVGEVVTIMRLRKSSTDAFEKIKIEIRWFYRERELSLQSKSNVGEEDLLTEEICESDHYDEVTPSSILAPICIYEDSKPVTIGKEQLGMPVVEFYCQRFWSVSRKSLKPVGRLEGRIERGRLRSNYFGKNADLRSALHFRSSENTQPIPSVCSGAVNYRDAFEKVIDKLSLTDASKEANESTAVLVGRENELEQIQAFLQASIKENKEERGDKKGCLFIAGPPGTGKTACVRAAVFELQRRQAATRQQNFDFVTLNGMEMRDPFEAYQRLWDFLRGEDSKCSAQVAVSKLDAYFSGKSGCEADNTDRVTVLLLDEIDYLETKTQSVLYNFFDWPSRSFDSKSKKRLVVIGVSNTLNLPERLHPRVRSRLGSTRIFFKSYSSNETVAILNAKLKQASPSYSVFDHDAIVFAAKKTASLSGDLRKAFVIARSAAEMVLLKSETAGAEAQTSPVVSTSDVVKVCRDSTNSVQSRSIGMCAAFEVLFLVTLAALSKTTGREYGGFDVEEILTKMESIANSHGDELYLPPPSLSETLEIVSQLRQSHLITTNSPMFTSLSHRASLTGCGGPWPLVSMVLDDIAVHQALRETEHAGLASKFLSKTYR
jgi:Cdc6-like AAA superfamily ATPase